MLDARTDKIVDPSPDIKEQITRIRTAQTMGKIATGLNNEARRLREAIDGLGIEDIHAPEGQKFKVQVLNRSGTLIIEPFLHRSLEWGDAYQPSDDEYFAMVKMSPYGYDASIKVDSITYDPGSHIWGFNKLRRVRVLIDDKVSVHLVEDEIPKEGEN